MKRRLFIALAILVASTVTALLVAAMIWPVINEVETGMSAEYPEIQPQYYTTDPQRVFEETRASVESLDAWTLVSQDAAQYRLKAQRETQVFGFIDDVSIRVEPVTEFVTRIHVKSASQIGKGDFGQNARNIKELFAALDARLGAVKLNPDTLRSDTAPADTPADDEKKGAEGDAQK
ncbi:DUF1499 domain-containing protein [Bradymonas sediminis]|uniref:Uncharacterized protein n=1 Tax=Bradymonas sediminis TaxID=1548548 RepID=A0A2Z4FLN1_9DELT|nr:DUF1499 domain-containing protein [Bradymonas sediminis]AWV89598.1 hypothetical protein DN745_09710 [Bradymonas sediminis]TDP76667.1 uncharacterized protein DUF1499 [Bradymonas sediminis]